MHAIIMVADRMELGRRISDGESAEPGPYCSCIKNSSVGQARYLIKYLRQTLKFKKSQISFLRGSRLSGDPLWTKLKEIILDNKDGDILLYYCGHGGEFGWGFNNYTFECVNYFNFKEILCHFKGRMIIINECCHALAIERFLSPIKGRYLLFGSSRKDKLGITPVNVLAQILEAWSSRKKSFPKVLYTKKNTVDNGQIIDICTDKWQTNFGICRCLHEFYVRFKEYPKRRPSLRRGAPLDYLMFP